MRLGAKLPIVVASSILALIVATSRAQQPAPARSGLGNNAALRYWQAYAQLPKLDERQEKLLAEPGDGTSDDAAKLVESGSNALLYLHRGAAIGPCDWGLHPEDGPYLLLPHLGKGRDLARLACLKARGDFSRGDGAAGVREVGDTFVMGRHLGSDLTAIITYLVQLAVERTAIEAAAPHLAGLDPAALDQLDKRLASLPPGGTLEQCMRVERDSFLEWAVSHLRQMNDQDPWKQRVLGPFASHPESREAQDKVDKVVAACGGTREGVLRQFEAMRPLYEELGPILRLPRDEFRAKFADLQERAKSNPVAVEVLPSMTKVYDRDAAGRTRMTMLRAAIAVVRGGPDKARDFKDAAGNPLEYAATADGFELRSKVVDDDKPVTLKVGGKKQ
jgi:hypothetical protein